MSGPCHTNGTWALGDRSGIDGRAVASEHMPHGYALVTRELSAMLSACLEACMKGHSMTGLWVCRRVYDEFYVRTEGLRSLTVIG